MKGDLYFRKKIIKSEIIDLVLETNSDILLKYKNLIKEYLSDVNDLKIFFIGIIFLNKKSYFGRYSFSYSGEVTKSLISKNRDLFLKIFKKPYPVEIYRNKRVSREFTEKFNLYLKYEILAYNYFFEKRYYDSEFEINIFTLQECKEKICEIYSLDKKIKFLSNKDTIVIKKGSEEKTYNLNEIIIKIFKSDTKETKLDEYIRKNYKNEYGIIYYYLNNFI